MENKFGDLLQTLRKEKGWTQQQLADLLHVTNKTVSKWERNEAYPETSTLIELSKLFQISLDDLLNGRKNEKAVEVVQDSYQNTLNQWQIVRSELFSKIMILLGLTGFYAVYFLTKLFAPSIFVMVFFLVLSFCFVLFRNEKIKVFTGKSVSYEQWGQWIATAMASLVLVIPCINFPIPLDTLEKQLEYHLSQQNVQGYVSTSGTFYGYSHLSFSNYVTWFPYLLILAEFVYTGVSALSKKKLTRSIKVVVLTMILAVSVSMGLSGLKNVMRPYKTMGESAYSNYKERYVTIVEAFGIMPDNLSDIDSNVANAKFTGKKRYESYMNVAGFDDHKKRVYFDLSDSQKELFKIVRLAVIYILSAGSVLVLNKKKMPE